MRFVATLPLPQHPAVRPCFQCRSRSPRTAPDATWKKDLDAELRSSGHRDTMTDLGRAGLRLLGERGEQPHDHMPLVSRGDLAQAFRHKRASNRRRNLRCIRFARSRSHRHLSHLTVRPPQLRQTPPRHPHRVLGGPSRPDPFSATATRSPPASRLVIRQGHRSLALSTLPVPHQRVQFVQLREPPITFHRSTHSRHAATSRALRRWRGRR